MLTACSLFRLRGCPGNGYVAVTRGSERRRGLTLADETVINGAQSIYKDQFGIGGESYRDTWLLGLTNAAPYLCCAVLGCCTLRPFSTNVSPN